jgi:hypothetical protein
LIHRESFTSPHKASVSQPGTPAEAAPEQGDPRLQSIEQTLFEIHARLMRTEESNTALSTKCAMLKDSLARCQQVRSFRVELSGAHMFSGIMSLHRLL